MATAKNTPPGDDPPPKSLDGFSPDKLKRHINPTDYIDDVEVEDVPDED